MAGSLTRSVGIMAKGLRPRTVSSPSSELRGVISAGLTGFCAGPLPTGIRRSRRRDGPRAKLSVVGREATPSVANFVA